MCVLYTFLYIECLSVQHLLQLYLAASAELTLIGTGEKFTVKISLFSEVSRVPVHFLLYDIVLRVQKYEQCFSIYIGSLDPTIFTQRLMAVLLINHKLKDKQNLVDMLRIFITQQNAFGAVGA